MNNMLVFIDLIHCGGALEYLRSLPDNSVHCCITSPPYWPLRDYGMTAQIGLEPTLQGYIDAIVAVMREVRRVLRPDGTCWLNLGDSMAGGKGRSGMQGAEHQERRNMNQRSLNRGYQTTGGKGKLRPTDNRAMLRAAGLKPKDIVMLPHRIAIALQDDKWYVRAELVWFKPNAMPESVTNRPTKAHEFIFLLTKSGKPVFWTHPTLPGCRKKPKPDYVWTKDDEETHIEPPDWKANGWKRRNLWRGHDYYYDIEAIKEPAETDDTSSPRGSNGVVGKKNSGRRKQDETGNRRYTGFNERYKSAPPIKLRNRRSVWTVPTLGIDDAHFATFPPELIEPMILAGVPATVCARCGAPHVRVRQQVVPSSWADRQQAGHKGGIGGSVKLQRQHGGTQDFDNHDGGFGTPAVYETVCFTPTCDCDAGTDAGVVLDPFMGSGTTALVAKRYDRHFAGSELNPQYRDIALKRLANDNPFATKRIDSDALQPSLFADPVIVAE